MKKVDIITILDNTNFGTYLQALATGLTVRSLGYEVEIINYVRPCMTPAGWRKATRDDFGLLSYLRRCVLRNTKPMWELKRRDLDFVRRFLPVSREYTSFEALAADPPHADIYLTGSDQVWNSRYNRGIDRAFYLDFAPEGTRRVAYAASIGMPEIPTHEMAETKALLGRYDAITVREQQGADLLRAIGIEASPVLDPTLLLDKAQWQKVADEFPMTFDEPYLLVYSVEHREQNQAILRYARAIARERGLKIYHVSYSRWDPGLEDADRHFFQATPEVFLQLMLHASFVVISSFHGTAFAVNFAKQFVTVAPGRFNSRVENLLNLTSLRSRLVDTASAIPDTDLPDIDFAPVQSTLASLRASSIDTLASLLSSTD